MTFFLLHIFEEKLSVEFETLVQDAFAKMDSQLDLWLHKILSISEKFSLTPADNQDEDFKIFWDTLPFNQNRDQGFL